MTAAFRVFFVGGRISYHALFNWIRPGLYVTTMLGSPLFQILFFTYLGRYATNRGDDFFIVGNAVQVSAMAGIYGDGDRERAVVRNALAAARDAGEPAGAVRGRAAFIANGLAVSAFGFAVGWLFLDFSPAPGSLPALAAVVIVTVASCTALGMLVGSIGLRARDVFAANLVYFLMLLVCGVNVPVDELPAWLGGSPTSCR